MSFMKMLPAEPPPGVSAEVFKLMKDYAKSAENLSVLEVSCASVNIMVMTLEYIATANGMDRRQASVCFANVLAGILGTAEKNFNNLTRSNLQ